ncbi:MAG: RNA polymerase sigma factor [Bacteroidota bacterium]
MIERCRKSDASAQFELYKLYSKAMFNTAYRIIGEQTEAEDALQEAFVSAFKNLHTYRGDATFGAWLKKIVVNKSLSSLQKNKREVLTVSDKEEDGDLEAALVNVAEVSVMEPTYSVEAIKLAVKQLPAGFRTVLSLYLFEGYDHQEISEILGISESTSKTQYKRAKDRLKVLLGKEVNYG